MKDTGVDEFDELDEQPIDCDDDPKLTADEWAYIAAVETE